MNDGGSTPAFPSLFQARRARMLPESGGGTGYPEVVVDLQLADSEEEAQRMGLRRSQAMDPAAKVGSLHHTVPKFYLRRFARAEQLLTRVPGEATPRIRNIADMGQKDFYTLVVDAEGLAYMQATEELPDDQTAAVWRAGAGKATRDGRLEDVLSTVEGRAATVLTRMTERPSASLTADERYALTTFLSFQIVRGVRTRREIELIGEFYAKTMLRQPLPPKARRRGEIAAARRAGRTPSRGNSCRLPPKRTQRDHLLTDSQLRKIGVTLQPNHHLLTLLEVPDHIGPHLLVRTFTLFELDQPLLVTGDEPVVVVSEGGADHRPSCFLTAKQRRRRLADATVDGREHRGPLHLYTTRPQAVAVARSVAITIDPSRAIVLGPKNKPGPTHVRLVGDAAAEFAEDLNARIVAQAFLWVVAHPDHPTLSTMTIPEPGPLIMACDGGSPAASTLNRPPEPRSANRLRRTDWQL